MNPDTGTIIQIEPDETRDEDMTRKLQEALQQTYTVPVSADQADEVKGMNRRQRREWAMEEERQKLKRQMESLFDEGSRDAD